MKQTAFGDGTLRPFTDAIWTASTPVRFAGTWFPHVMTVIRLRSGELLLHSPCSPSSDLLDAIAQLGNVAHVVAPNWFHDLYLRQYRNVYSNATFWAPMFLRLQHPRLIDAVLNSETRPPWFDEMPHVTLTGLLTFNESVFFHQATRTLIVADLFMNASAVSTAPALTRFGYRIFGLDGNLKVFPILRWFGFVERASLRLAARQVLEWNPDRVIVAHGKPIAEDAMVQISAALRWL